jgi:hypothetical protein
VTEEDSEDLAAGIDDTGRFFETVNALPSGDTYTEMDRYRDFRRVFLDTEEGRRVFRTLLQWGHMFRTSMPPGHVADPLKLAFSEGERNLALRMVDTINREPRSRPVTANRKKGD